MNNATPQPTLDLDAFTASLSAEIDRAMARKKEEKLRAAATKKQKSSGHYGEVENQLAQKLKIVAQERALRDPYEGWTERSRIVWIETQTCQCCHNTSQFVGGMFLEVENPVQRARAYIRRSPVQQLPLKIEFNPVQQSVPVCISCVKTLTDPVEPTVDALLYQLTDPSERVEQLALF